MRFLAFLLFFSAQILNASLNEGSVDTGPIITKGMREIAFDVNLTTCPKDTPEGGVLYFRGGYTLNRIMGGFEVGTIPDFDAMEPMPFETLFSLLLHGTTTHPVDFRSNIITGIESAFAQLSPQSHRSPELFFIRTLEDAIYKLMDELEKTHQTDQLNELANSGPKIMGMAAVFSAYLNHQENGGTYETFMRKKDGLFDTPDDFVKTFMKMAIDTEYQEDPRLHKILNIYFDLLIGHGMNLSTSVLIQTASGNGHVVNSIVAAFNALNSDNHGRAALKAHEMFRHIKSNYNGNVTDFIQAVKEKRETLWGHGHATYKKGEDPRAEIDEILARTLLDVTSDQELKEDIMLALNLKEEALKQGLGWQTNVDYFASLILRGCKISPKLSTVMFATSRLGSWLADLHQFGLEKHPLMRPLDKPFEQNPLLRKLDEF